MDAYRTPDDRFEGNDRRRAELLLVAGLQPGSAAAQTGSNELSIVIGFPDDGLSLDFSSLTEEPQPDAETPPAVNPATRPADCSRAAVFQSSKLR